MLNDGTPPLTRPIDVRDVSSIGALRTRLLDAAKSLYALPSGQQPPSLEIAIVDAAGERTRFAGRSQLGALRKAHELVVTFGHATGGRTSDDLDEHV